MRRAKIYSEMQRTNPEGALRLALDEIRKGQKALRKEYPKSILLKMVELSGDGKRIGYDGSFKRVTREHSGWDRRTNIYALLGVYVDLLESELRSPRFSAPKSLAS